MTGPERAWLEAELSLESGEWEFGRWFGFNPGGDSEEYIRADLHTAALSAEYARGLRDAVSAVPTWGVDSDVGDKVRDAIIALIPLPPSPVDASPGADPDNKGPPK